MATRTPDLDLSEELVSEFGENASYVAELLARYRTNPEAVDEEWRAFFRERIGEPAAERRDPSAASPAPAPPAAAPPATSVAAAPSPGRVEDGERVPIRGAALRIAENMEASLGVPTATSQRQVPIKLLDENRRLINEHRGSNGQGKVSFTHLVAWAVLRALKTFPRLNDAFDAGGGTPSRVRRDRVGFGLAVDVEKSDGTRTLLVPSVKGAEEMTFAQFASAADDLIARARKGKLQVFDFEGTTISLTNPGTLGTTASVPRLMPGQGLIVATGAIEYPAEFSAMSPEALARLAVSKVVTFTSTYDHRIIQGA
ncbi:MAG: 2-oxo acid dehydrogenase subunit E2, partial [Acidobacteriota bacterium]